MNTTLGYFFDRNSPDVEKCGNCAGKGWLESITRPADWHGWQAPNTICSTWGKECARCHGMGYIMSASGIARREAADANLRAQLASADDLRCPECDRRTSKRGLCRACRADDERLARDEARPQKRNVWSELLA